MIDIHSHILYDLDDGAGTLEDSVAMVRTAAAAGTIAIVASPHANQEYTFDPVAVEARIAEVRGASGVNVDIYYGCDFHLTLENVEDALAHPSRYTINHRNYLLVEFADFAIPPNSAAIFGRMLAAGLRPVVTHPERNQILQRRLPQLMEWTVMGCLMQVTAASFTGLFGREARKTAERLMASGNVHVVASDAHDCEHRPPVLRDAYAHVAKEYGEEAAQTLFLINPRAIIEGAPLPAGPVPVRKKKKWYQRF